MHACLSLHTVLAQTHTPSYKDKKWIRSNMSHYNSQCLLISAGTVVFMKETTIMLGLQQKLKGVTPLQLSAKLAWHLSRWASLRTAWILEYLPCCRIMHLSSTEFIWVQGFGGSKPVCYWMQQTQPALLGNVHDRLTTIAVVSDTRQCGFWWATGTLLFALLCPDRVANGSRYIYSFCE